MVRRGRRDDHEIFQTSEIESDVGAEVTVIGRGSRVQGTVESAGSLRIEGEVKGKITAKGEVTVSSQSTVEADIEAQDIVVGGRFKGDISARGKAELTRGAHVEGNIRSTALVVGEGAVFHGQSVMGGDEDASASGPLPSATTERPAEPGEPADGDPDGDLLAAHKDAARHAAEWFSSRLPGSDDQEAGDVTPPREAEPEPEPSQGRSRRSKPRPGPNGRQGSRVGSRG